MTGEAEVRVAGHPGLFVGTVTIDPTRIHGSGRWRRRLGVGESWSDPCAYSWASSLVLEVRWTTADAEVLAEATP